MNETKTAAVDSDTARVVAALRRVGEIWAARLAGDWTPPDGSTFPWAQVRLSLAALVPGLKEAGTWLEKVVSGARDEARAATPANEASTIPLPLTTDHRPPTTSLPTAALILAGNTPLLSWSPLCACLLAGWRVRVKMSRGETLWSRLFWESLHDADPEIAARAVLDVWPGDDARTAELAQSADAVIAFGGDQTLAALRELTPTGTPFFGFGHAVSIGVGTRGGIWQAGDFAHDVLMYQQEGCLSAQAILVDDRGSGADAKDAAYQLQSQFHHEVQAWQIPPVTDEAGARAVRSARDLALFLGDALVLGDDGLRWTIICRTTRARIEFPTGHRVVQVIPISFAAEELARQIGAVRGYISSVGVAGKLPDDAHEMFLAEGVSRICRAGEMQTPPLDWPNGNVDLLAELMHIAASREP